MRPEDMPIWVHINQLPSWAPHLHKMVQKGFGDTYRDLISRVYVAITPTPSECGLFPDLKGVEKVFFVYRKKEVR